MICFQERKYEIAIAGSVSVGYNVRLLVIKYFKLLLKRKPFLWCILLTFWDGTSEDILKIFVETHLFSANLGCDNDKQTLTHLICLLETRIKYYDMR